MGLDNGLACARGDDSREEWTAVDGQSYLGYHKTHGTWEALWGGIRDDAEKKCTCPTMEQS